ncbi:hypothetical protein ETH_00034345 [Eimeria tenella]|uniref:Uncharacterized protein n=1 Tax=Eimeria tenella TaxID=5802 RepID=U6L7S0_EIMTE|nr:hypothetical protein ETH_00034345 [Eimeria tenella]CDJ44619.1 hypothetical protein ETH_00034345 [Eimeria tenella]|eukprot:XP_013235367.1 hypothetical protein ETH_00034345 [Eimeria tenella]
MWPEQRGRAGRGVYVHLGTVGWFFPDYLRAIWRIIGHHFGSEVSVEYQFYESVEAAQAAVAAGEADMTDIYFLLSHRNSSSSSSSVARQRGAPKGGPHKGGAPMDLSNPLSLLYMSCPVVGAVLFTYTREGSKNSYEGLIEAFSIALIRGEGDAKTTVVVPTEELKAIVGPVLPDWVTVHVVDNMAVALRAVASGEAYAAISVGPSPSSAIPPGVTLRDGIDLVAAKGAWVRRSRSPKCLRREHINSFTR